MCQIQYPPALLLLCQLETLDQHVQLSCETLIFLDDCNWHYVLLTFAPQSLPKQITTFDWTAEHEDKQFCCHDLNYNQTCCNYSRRKIELKILWNILNKISTGTRVHVQKKWKVSKNYLWFIGRNNKKNITYETSKLDHDILRIAFFIISISLDEWQQK